MKSFSYLLLILLNFIIFNFGMTQTISNNIALISKGTIAWDNGSYWHPIQQLDMDAIHAIDGIDSTYWAGLQDSIPQKMWIEFDQKYWIDKIQIKENDPNAYILAGTIEYYDGFFWHVLTTINKSSAGFNYKFNAVEAWQVVLKVDSVQAPGTWTNKVALIHEFEVNGYTDGLVAYYPFNGDANDESGNGFHGQDLNVDFYENDRFKNPFTTCLFNSGQDRIDFQNLILPNSKSLSFWMISNRELSKNDNWEIGFVDAGVIPGSMFGFMYGVDDCQDLGFWGYYPNNNYSIESKINKWSSDSSWHHIVITYDTNNVVQIFIDNIRQLNLFKNSDSTIVSEFQLIETIPTFKIASRHNHNYDYKVIVDDICIYNRELSQIEIDSLFHDGDWPTDINELSESNVSVFELYPNFPNPFNPTTEIKYSIKKIGNVKINIFNSLGQKVKTLLDKVQSTGTHEVAWDATDDYGNNVSSGTYFYQIQAGKYIQTKRMIYLQ